MATSKAMERVMASVHSSLILKMLDDQTWQNIMLSKAGDVKGNNVINPAKTVLTVTDDIKKTLPKEFNGEYNDLEKFVDKKSIIEYNDTLRNIIKICENAYKKDSKFYGVLVQSDNQEILNPLNPITAYSILANHIDMLDEEFTAFFYEFKSNVEVSDKDLGTCKTYENLLKSVIVNKKEEIVDFSKYKIYQHLWTSDSDIAIAIVKDQRCVNLGITGEQCLIPLQVFNNGIVFPIYGATFFNGKAFTCFNEVKSTNIGKEGLNVGVCTGGKGTNKNGLSTLNHSNRLSPLSGGNFTNDYPKMAKESIACSLELYDAVK